MLLRNKLQKSIFNSQLIAELTTIFQNANPLALYHLSTQPEFQEMFLSLRIYLKEANE